MWNSLGYGCIERILIRHALPHVHEIVRSRSGRGQDLGHAPTSALRQDSGLLPLQ